MKTTVVTYKFHHRDEPIVFAVPSEVVRLWVEEKRPIAYLRRLGYVLDFHEVDSPVAKK